MRDRRMQQRITVVLGILLTFAMLSSTALGLLRSLGQRASSQVIAETATPPATVPPPITNLESIDFSQRYLHPSGLFTAAVPDGWVAGSESQTAGEARVIMQNPRQQSVLEIRVTRPTAEQDISTMDGVSAIFNDSWLRSSWREYTTWDEAQRTVQDDHLIIDFNLTRSGQDFIARQISFTDGTWVYSVRAVAPSNASEMLRYLVSTELTSFAPLEQFVGTPIDWKAYFSDSTDEFVRYPATWTIADSAPGAPVSISGDNAQLRVEVLNNPIDSEVAASDYVSGLRSGIEVLSVEAIEQSGTAGYSVAYALTTLDGGTQSGLVTILNGDAQTHVANLLLTDISATDLNSVDVEAEDTPAEVKDAKELMQTFSLQPELQVTNAGTE